MKKFVELSEQTIWTVISELTDKFLYKWLGKKFKSEIEKGNYEEEVVDDLITSINELLFDGIHEAIDAGDFEKAIENRDLVFSEDWVKWAISYYTENMNDGINVETNKRFIKALKTHLNYL